MFTFKYEELRVAALMFDKNEYLFKFYLKSGYHHVDIHPECYELNEGTASMVYSFTFWALQCMLQFYKVIKATY